MKAGLLVLCFVLALVECYPKPSDATFVQLMEAMREIGKNRYQGLKMEGHGPNWKQMNGVTVLWIGENEPFNVMYENLLTHNNSIVHAHGMTPPIHEDGAPFVSALPIPPQNQQLVSYSISPDIYGTYYIHSHWGFQLGEGMSAPLVVEGGYDLHYPLTKQIQAATQVMMKLEDICPIYNTNAEELADMIKNGRPYVDFPCNENAVFQQLQSAWHKEHVPPSECNPFPPDGLDVGYHAHVTNGKLYEDRQQISVKPGETVRLRIVNAAGMSQYFIAIPSELNAILIATDGKWVQPLKVTSMNLNNGVWIGVAQRLDIYLTIPAKDNMAYDVLAYPEGVSLSGKSGLTFTTDASKSLTPVAVPVTKPVGFMDFAMEKQLQAWIPLKPANPDRVFELNLTGDNGFASMNNHSYQLPPTSGKPYYPNPWPLQVKLGERVHIRIINHNSDNHSMHLHGHQYQIVEINGKKVNGAMRDTVVVPGGCQEVVFAFEATNPGTWLFHCHLEFHLAAGMLTTVEYII